MTADDATPSGYVIIKCWSKYRARGTDKLSVIIGDDEVESRKYKNSNSLASAGELVNINIV